MSHCFVVKNGQKIMMTGTAESKMLEPEPTDLNVVNDLDLPDEVDGISVRNLSIKFHF